MAVIDNRTLQNSADTLTGIVAVGSPGQSADPDAAIYGANAIGWTVTNATTGVLLPLPSGPVDLVGNHAYIWVNCGVKGLLVASASGGFAVRFANSAGTAYRDRYLFGGDSTFYTGGWKMFVVDVDDVFLNPDVTVGTLSANSVGLIGTVGRTAAMPKMALNSWTDAIWTLPADTPGIILSASVDGGWDDVVTTAANSAWGTVRQADGVIFVNTPIQFGSSVSADHSFQDTNKVIAWEQQAVASGFYNFSFLGGSAGTQRCIWGNRVGTGDDSTGNQGMIVVAPAAGPRWGIIATDANQQSTEFIGCTFVHGEELFLSASAVDLRSTLLNDITKIHQGNSKFAANTIVQANTLDGVALVSTAELREVRNNSFAFSDGHAVEITSAGSYDFVGNTFTNYGASGTNDAAIYNNSGGDVTINVTDGDTPTYRSGVGATTSVNNNVTVTFNDLVLSTEVRVYNHETTNEIAGEENVNDGSFDFTVGVSTTVDVRIFAVGYIPNDFLDFVVPAGGTTIPVQQTVDRTYENP